MLLSTSIFAIRLNGDNAAEATLTDGRRVRLPDSPAARAWLDALAGPLAGVELVYFLVPNNHGQAVATLAAGGCVEG